MPLTKPLTHSCISNRSSAPIPPSHTHIQQQQQQQQPSQPAHINILITQAFLCLLNNCIIFFFFKIIYSFRANLYDDKERSKKKITTQKSIKKRTLGCICRMHTTASALECINIIYTGLWVQALHTMHFHCRSNTGKLRNTDP